MVSDGRGVYFCNPSQALGTMRDASRPLPPLWERKFDLDLKVPYFFCSATGISTLYHPLDLRYVSVWEPGIPG